MDTLSAVVLLVVAVGAVCQIVSGVGFALVTSPLLVLALGHDRGVRTVLLLSILLNVVVLVRSFRHVRAADALRLLVPAALLIVPAVLLSNAFRPAVLAVVAGAVILLASGLVAAGRALPFLDGVRGAVLAGALSGAFTVLAGAGGPPVALFAAQRQWPPAVASATLQAFALPLNVLTLLVLGPTAEDLPGLGWALAGLALGALAAVPLARRVPAAAVRRLTLAVAALGGAALVVGGLAGAA
ncbi:TSUP family transporter [Rathayibacter sp. SD072]|uniref:TSUP family transporter n=1 Tax=Rathayibacter sp. SD072 TaxID=2781731 RepID=UPI001A958932|nr:TSUP family transporter [Rathayibacter sp. SD072]MBO0985808.1 TSUP family transporter [Rathayibacter sp. SD072]